MKNLLIILLLVTGCRTAAYETTQGVKVYCENPDRCPSNIDTSTMIDLFVGLAPNTEHAKAMLEDVKMTIYFHNEPLFDCGTASPTTGLCYGTYWGGWIELGYNQCIANTSLGHELAHAYIQYTTGKPNYAHDDLRFFGMTCSGELGNVTTCRKKTVEWRARDIGKRLLCPDTL